MAYSQSKVRKSGSIIRKHARGEASDQQLADAMTVISDYRNSFEKPTGRMQDLLRTLLEQMSLEGDVTQRIKKLPTIVEKLRDREQTLDVTRMQDIGGCRLVVPSIDDVRRVEEALLQELEGPPMRRNDYIVSPRTSGYRAVHVVHEQFGQRVEVQLRSEMMHKWAMISEAMSNALGINLKQDGGHPVQMLLKQMSRVYRIQEEGTRLSGAELEDLRREYTKAATDAQPYLNQTLPGTGVAAEDAAKRR